MAINRVREHLKQWNKDGQILEFAVSSATVELAAQAVHCEPERIAKTLSFQVDDGCVLIVTAGDAKIDNGKFKAAFKSKAKMLPPEKVIETVGHEPGGVCPFGINEGVRVYLDISLKRFTHVYPACGSSNSAIELTLEELALYSNSLAWVDVCKAWSGAPEQEQAQENGKEKTQ